ncbi:hypothetical protein OF385_04555 [Glutamicibacter sp. JL.03c]|uniref:hypothetical protein n=1 Tax=Glutamicibacter sp. JL.03c TaxID=2984842 RepID=UPI0021F7A46C|nr:hypothetical protein [Glutamicibacter sp. JL.03c]UYQ78427.1 hypothetical protein OF385_04555 [Glutamicibacter sp. JL.03c]
MIVLLGVIHGLSDDDARTNFGIIPWIAFPLAVAAGLIRRLILARRQGNLRQGFEPLGDAGIAIENMAMGKEPDSRPGTIQHAGKPQPEDPLS